MGVSGGRVRSITSCIRKGIPDEGLYPLDPEIEKTLLRRRGQRAMNQDGNNPLAMNEKLNPGALNVNPPDAQMFDDWDRPIREHVVPILDNLKPGIGRPKIQALHFELKPVMFQMLQSIGQFGDALKLKLFPYSLRDHARTWLNALPSGTVESWNDLCQRFLLRYNPSNINAKLRNDITSFKKLEDETLYEAWERFKDLLRKYPMYGF
ncbi:protein FAR1-RELATED SEQUENCE 5-like [Gossypium australe]|uniref:Protein FAR1-RELATED SEQUENCE 5-like n=1 Tax=Gossypium australe TaxID=47621 RepID=A0A5B6UCN7_9ROSI|nr:protein FAR1-RELATED SEQUENCE 5-like [Gossypium australe]